MRDFHLPGRSPVFAANGLCATSHPLAAATAIDLLKSGGNAMDAAIGAAVLLGLCEPQMTGLGGDCFVLFTPPGEETVKALNGSGRAPAGLSAEALRDQGHIVVPLSGATPVTVPGAVDAFCRLSEDWGRLSLEETLAPAIRYAEEGIPVAPRVAFDWAASVDALVGPGRAHFLDHFVGQTRRGLRLDDHDALVAYDDAGVRIAFRREGVKIAADLGKGDLLVAHVAG
jgi:gamma-glutamyltranspeptidase/glutathione hydrolase